MRSSAATTAAAASPLISRRQAVALLISSSALGAGASQASPSEPSTKKRFGYEEVVAQARMLSERAFDAEGPAIPAELSKLTYDSYREIRFRRDKAFWREGGSDYRLHLFHLGFLHNRAVQIHTIKDGNAIPIAFTTGLFEYGKAPVPKQLSPSLGFAGFAVTTNLNDPKVQDEVISFLGASYFRLIGRGHRYGLSARALALDVGGKQPEEFPFFRALWIEEPTAESRELVIYALLDSPSVAGAYRFIVKPGKLTTLQVTATVMPRTLIHRIGIAPLTSMFLAGEGDLAQRPDFRPEIHDSDGLLMRTGGDDWIWRPLRNPKQLRISSFTDRNPRGFGLLQRDREFEHYQDLEAQYHARPGYWIEPLEHWGEGRVDLIEIPTAGEGFDNIVACWTPSAPLPPGKGAEFNYRISALSTSESLHSLGQVKASFCGVDVEDIKGDGAATKRFIVDFAGGDLGYYQSDPNRVEIVAATSAGSIAKAIIDPNPAAKGFRAIVDAILPAGESAELRLYLKSRTATLTETWTCSWSAAAR